MKLSKTSIFLHRLTALLMLIGTLATVSCVGAPNAKRKKDKSSIGQKTSGTGDTSDPVFSSPLNYLQNGTSKSSSNINLDISFEDSFYLRGEEVNGIINPSTKSTVQCLVVRFPQSVDNKLLVMALTPQFFFNFSTQVQEYYYLVSPSNSQSNQTFCNRPGVLTALAISYPTETVAYSVKELCPNCTSSILVSDPLELRTTSGANIDKVNTNYLSIKLSNSGGGTIAGPSCSSTEGCVSKGFDCCSLGQCVKDKQLKDGIDTSTNEFAQSKQDILSNPSNIFNYPNFYHLCSIDIVPEPTPTPSPDPAVAAAKRFTKLQELFKCTSPIEGELSLCTSTFEDATTNASYKTGNDDRSFFDIYHGTNPVPEHSINQIIYAGELLYSNDTFLKDNFTINGINKSSSSKPQGNDTLTDPVSIFIDAAYNVSSSAEDSALKIEYKIDGSCKRVSSTLAKCEKHYVQGENLSKVTDHFPASNSFKLPFYADTNKTIKVEVDDTTKLQGAQWALTLTSPAEITFQGTGLQVFDTQVVKMTFFVDLSGFDVLQAVEAAQDEIDIICGCGNLGCRLTEVKDNNTVVDYSCKYPLPDSTPPPLQQTVLLSSKTVPVRYFDKDGVYQKNVTFQSKEQEGNKFEYIGGNLLKPNNIASYIGFNEIYGPLSFLGTQAKSAKEVSVVKGKSYDIFVDTGTFSSCFFCGTDYFSNVTKLFPANFQTKGGGYTPDLQTTDPVRASAYPAHDKIFGRACFLPASMVPWSQKTSSDRQQQRLNRMTAQHFLFSNGYQRDWFGFDYGSIIGSFDGVRWFSIGNQRRIKAQTTKLFLAVNAYFGDQTIESTFTIVVSDASTTPLSGSTVTSDFESDGAQCQQSHICNTDQDCATQLGWDYACESVSTIKSKWPSFDSNALEVPELETQQSLINLIGGLGASAKRCVYRGRGAPCSSNYDINDPTNSYSGTDSLRLHACSPNNYCQQFVQGVKIPKFNNKIARYGKSVRVQNSSSTVAESDLDEFGFGARIIGRPYAYHGTEAILNNALSVLNNNSISSICIPGRDPEDDKVKSANKSIPGPDYLGDQVTGIGMSLTGDQNSAYLSSCSIFNSGGNYIQYDSLLKEANLSSASISVLAGNQAISTNSLNVLGALVNKDFTKKYENNYISSFVYQPNRCLRAPGSVCHSDIECAPSKHITQQLNGLNADDVGLYSIINKYEILFWKEALVCSQEALPGTDGHDLTKNRCCRESGNEITIGNFYDQSAFGALDPSIAVINNTSIPGIDIALSSPSRYSRVATVIDKLTSPTNAEPPIQAARADKCTLGAPCQIDTVLDNQWKSISTLAGRTCCSKNWVRNFHKDDNGGGHTWGPGKHQDIPKESFRCLNWSQCNTATGSCGTRPFTCDHVVEPDDLQCLMRETSNTEASIIFNWLNTMELMGIPQISVKSEDFSDIRCKVNPENQEVLGVNPPPNLITVGADAEYVNSDANNLYSADDKSNFNSGLKKIFSEDTFSCCLPTGTVMSQGDDPKLCCTGLINGNNNQCALPDFTNVTVYFNRYVSSAAKDLRDSQIDAKTGYIKNPLIVENLACQQKVCASGTLARGIVLSNLKVPGKESSNKTFRRFIDSSDLASNANGLADLYDSGLRWNDDVYCIPTDLANNGANDIKVTICNQ